MKRRKYEFKPDKPYSNWFSRMMPTRTQRFQLLKWSLCALVLIVLSVLQDAVLSRLPFLPAGAELVPCCIFLFCLLEGPENGSVFALTASCFYLFSGSAPGPFSIVTITATAILFSILQQVFLQPCFSSAMICTALAMVLYEMLTFLTGILLSHTLWSRLPVFLYTAVFSLIAAPLLYPVGLAIGRIGGTIWKE